MLDSFFISVLNMSIVSSYVISFVLIIRLLLKKTPKIFSYALWAVVLFRLLCPFSFESVISILPNSTVAIPQDIFYSQSPQISTGIGIVDNSINPILPAPSNIGESINPLQVWSFIGSLMWMIGIAVLFIYSMVTLIKLKRNLMGSTPLRGNIYLADHINSPFVMGIIKPGIYLPSSLSENEHDFIIAHETCHIKRFDHIIRTLAFIALTLHWFNPLVWIAFILSEKDMEMSCDESVMKQMENDIRAEYSQSLLRFATGSKMIHVTPLAFGEGDTKDRVKNVMKYKKPMLLVVVISIIAVACMAVALMSNPKNNGVGGSAETLETEATSVKRLWENRTEYVGNNSAVGNIISELSFPSNVIFDHFELKTDIEPYGITVYFNATENALKKVDENTTALNIDFDEFETNAKIMFSLIGNVDKITFDIHKDNGEKLTADFQRKNYDEVFDKTKTLEGFKSVLTELLGTEILSDFEAIKIGTTEEKFTLDKAVSLALLSEGLSEDVLFEGECGTEGHIILGYDDSDKNNIKIYALSVRHGYGFENDNFVETSGTGVIPLIVTLDNMNNVDAEYPLNGSEYIPFIKEMFPQEYHERILNGTDEDYDNLKQQEKQYVEDYLKKINRKAKIGDYSDFEYTLLTQAGVSVEASNGLENFYKEHDFYPSFIGTRERLEDGTRMVYEMSYNKNKGQINFKKYFYDTKEVVEVFQASAETGHMVDGTPKE